MITSHSLDLPENVGALAPDVVGVGGGHVHVQVTHVGLLGVGLQTAAQPVGLGAPQEGVGDEDEPWGQEQGVMIAQLHNIVKNSLVRKKSVLHARITL